MKSGVASITLLMSVAGFLPLANGQDTFDTHDRLAAAVSERLHRHLERVAQDGDGELKLRLDKSHKRHFYCAPHCVVLLLPDGVLWAAPKENDEGIRKPQLIGQWRFSNNVLTMQIPAGRRRALPQTYRIPIDVSRAGTWLADARQHINAFKIDADALYTKATASAGGLVLPLEVADTFSPKRPRRSGRYSPWLLVDMSKAIHAEVRAQAAAEHSAAKQAAAEAAAEAKALAERRRQEAAARRKAANENVKAALSASPMDRDHIRALQTALSEAGESFGAADGLWGKRSAVALRRWVLKHRNDTVSHTAARNVKQLLGEPPKNEIHIFDAQGDIATRVKCTPGEALMLGGQIIPCGTQVQR